MLCSGRILVAALVVGVITQALEILWAFDAHKIFDEIPKDSLETQPLKIDIAFYSYKCANGDRQDMSF